jgi:hypothetical protein
MHLGHYPAKHRALIWRFLLRLPENTREYSDLGKSNSEESVVVLLDLLVESECSAQYQSS